MLTITGKTTLHIKEMVAKGEKFQSIQICLAKNTTENEAEYAYVPVILSNNVKKEIDLEKKLKFTDKVKIEVEVVKGWLTFSKGKDKNPDTIKVFINEIK